VFGLLAQLNIGKLLVAGVIPGILITITIMLTVYTLVVMNPKLAPLSPKVPTAEKIRLVKIVGPMLVLIILVTGVIYTGVATPTEASALGAFGAFLITLGRRQSNILHMRSAITRAAGGTCMIATILLGASLFGYFFTLTQVPQSIVAWIGALHTSRWTILLLLLAGYIVLGAFMDQIAILILTVPIVLPIIHSLGFDPIWFGVITIVTAEIGMVTPPVGLNCFVVARYANRPVGEVFQGIWPHFVAHLIAIAILLAFPALTLWLPSKMR
jgi:tripartite ATP-independent transporter DctM subunit